jgi:hypothetical protein
MEQQCGFARWFHGRGTVGGGISAAFATFVDFQLVAPGRATLSQTNINRGCTRLRCRSRGPSTRADEQRRPQKKSIAASSRRTAKGASRPRAPPSDQSALWLISDRY